MKKNHSGGGPRMDSTARLLKRYLWLYDFLVRSKGGATREEIAEGWQRSILNEDRLPLSERTFHDHRRAVQELLDVDILCNRSSGCKYYIDPRTIQSHSDTKKWLLESFAFNMILHEYSDIQHRIIYEKVPTSHSEYLLTLVEAIQNNQMIELEYHGFAFDYPSVAKVYPYALRLFRQRWYLIAKEEEKDGAELSFYDEEGIDERTGIKVYALDRIKVLTLLDSTFEFPEGIDIESLYEDCFGIIIGDEDWEYIRIKTTKKQANFIRSLPLHHSQKEEPLDGEHVLFTYKLRPTYDLFQTLLSMGDAIEILSPEWVREELAKKVDHLYYTYRGERQSNNYNVEL
ncbi:hypothetical protein IX308_000150 [Porphyromonas levii]|uniref:helix-turn-helix transcriptional regulator n=1 Tax=Porphyromonas levii TaxID=28114 RepID=UPI001B8D1D68|nr:WYL domain-containing protein [Porphyromonas levii]MBR8769687.1 hypothetical protein [Porphyromonas levii]MBR8783992.1 hypothetical protein [Porphyromonas levii]